MVVIWSGSNPIEQLFRGRVYWWLRDQSVSVTEIQVDTRDMYNPPEWHYAAVAPISVEQLKLRFYRTKLCVTVVAQTTGGGMGQA